jgi:Zn-dependent protease
MIVIVLIAIDIHELAHAIVADRLGDSTPRRLGEISLNPMVHMDQFGIVLLLLTAFSGFGFTYGRTHVNPSNMKFGPQRGNAIVALAGPVANLILAALVAAVLTLIGTGTLSASDNIDNFLYLALALNLFLFVFNLLPIPPLDGFTILGGFMTARQMYSMAPLIQWGPLVILLLFVGEPYLHFFSNVVYPAVSNIFDLFCANCPVTTPSS